MVSAEVLQEIAARYGVTIAPGVTVTRLPVGASAQPLPVWNGTQLVYPDWKERRAAEAKAAVARARAARRADPVVFARRAQVAALHATGATVPVIMRQSGLQELTVRADLAQLGLAAHRMAPDSSVIVALGQQRLASNLARIREMAAAGAGEDAIAQALDLTNQTYRRGLIRRAVPDFEFADKRHCRPAQPRKARRTEAERAAARDAATLQQRLVMRDRMAPYLPGCSMNEIATALGMKRNTVATTIRRLRAAGLLPAVEAAPVQPRITTPRRNPWAVRNAAILALADAGATVEAIVAEVGCSRAGAVDVLRQAGRVPVYQRVKAQRDRVAALAGLVAQGLSPAVIAARLGITGKAVWSMAARAGVSLCRGGPPVNKGQISAAVALRREVVASLVRQGARQAHIVTITGVSAATISADILALGLSGQSLYARARPSFARDNPQLWPAVMQAFASGRPVKAIARDMGLKWTDVRAIIACARAAAGAAAAGSERQAA